MAGNERASNIFKSGLNWAVDAVIERWPQIVTFILGMGGFTYLASISAALKAYGIIGWVSVGLVMTLVAAGIFALFSYGRFKNTLATLQTMRAATASTNVLAPTHENERINLIDFYRPGFQTVERVRFAHCQLFGPMNVVIQGNTFNGVTFRDCEFVIVKEMPLKNCLAFQSCQFVDGALCGVTFLITRDAYNRIPESLRTSIPVVSDTDMTKT